MFTAAQTRLSQSVRLLGQSRLVRNLGWMTAAETVSRLGRIVTAIILARTMDMTTFGVAAMAITVFELTRIFTENGIGAAVIRAPDETVAAIANTAHRMMWIVCIGLSVLQAGVGLVALHLFPDTDIGWMIFALSGVYLVMPFGLVHAYMLIRAERMKRLAVIASSQTLADHLLTAVLALSGFGAWSIVLPKILTTPIWLFGVRHGKPWKRDAHTGYHQVWQILQFSVPVLLSELAVAAREQCDKLLISAFFGLEVLGLYYFAFNAGLGLSTALNRALNAALYPFLCATEKDGTSLEARFRRALLLAALPLAGVYCAQAAGALIYVPMLFGTNWTHAAPLVALLCLGGPARLLLDSVRIYWRASGHTAHEFKLSLAFAAGTLLPIPMFAVYGLYAASAASIAGATLAALLLARPHLFAKPRPIKLASQIGDPA